VVELDNMKVVTSRLCVCFKDFEQVPELEERRVRAMTLQKKAFVRLNYERIFVDEVLQLMPRVRQPARLMNGIIIKLGVDLGRFETNEKDRKLLHEMVQQTEAIYCYSSLKSMAMSELEQENRKIACIVTGYKLETQGRGKTPFYALAATEKNGGPLKHFISKDQARDLLDNHTSLGKLCFFKAFEYVQKKKLHVLDTHSAFCIPFNPQTILTLCKLLDDDTNVSEITRHLSSYPQEDLKLCEAQILLLQEFKKYLQEKYYSKIISNVEKMIYREFPEAIESINLVTQMSDLNPLLQRFFSSLVSF